MIHLGCNTGVYLAPCCHTFLQDGHHGALEIYVYQSLLDGQNAVGVPGVELVEDLVEVANSVRLVFWALIGQIADVALHTGDAGAEKTKI